LCESVDGILLVGRVVLAQDKFTCGNKFLISLISTCSDVYVDVVSLGALEGWSSCLLVFKVEAEED
jgi:hypothetical protein